MSTMRPSHAATDSRKTARALSSAATVPDSSDCIRRE